MQTPPEIQFVDGSHSDAVEIAVRERIAKLEQFFDKITSCHVFIDTSHHREGKGCVYEVRIEIRVPGSELAVNKKPGDVNAHEDVFVAVRDAFNAMERQLKRWKRQSRDKRPVRKTAPSF